FCIKLFTRSNYIRLGCPLVRIRKQLAQLSPGASPWAAGERARLQRTGSKRRFSAGWAELASLRGDRLTARKATGVQPVYPEEWALKALEASGVPDSVIVAMVRAQ